MNPESQNPQDASKGVQDTPNTQTKKPPRRSDGTVRDILSAWKVKRPAYSVATGLRPALLALLLILILTVISSTVLFICAREEFFSPSISRPSVDHEDESGGGVANHDGDRPFADGVSGNILLPWAENVKIIPAGSIHASFAALADLSNGEIIASRKADEVIYPASMTKVMTLIVVVENLPNTASLQDTITVSNEVYEEMVRQGSSGIGMEPGEKMTVESMLYALMLKSDGIAACELARYIAGSEEDFVELMNQKTEKMGLSNTHFENPTGLFHKDHKTTSRDIASIMAYAMNMRLCRKILMTQSYTAPCIGADGRSFNYNIYHNLIVTQFEKIPNNQPTEVTVAAGKTGYTDESRYCLVTYAESADGHGYVCVTAKSGGYAECINDYLTIYNTYVKP